MSLQRLPGDGGWFASGQEPASGGRGHREADDGDGEVADRHAAQGAEVVVVAGDQCEVGADRAEQDA